MENYIKNFNTFNEVYIYDFRVGDGGIGDCIKFFMCLLDTCIKRNIRLYYKKNNIELERYIKLKYEKIYFFESKSYFGNYHIVKPRYLYDLYDSYEKTKINNFIIKIKDVFYFTEEIIHHPIIQMLPKNYISIHLRLGDKYLETDHAFIQVPDDVRDFNEENIFKYIEENNDKNIFFCCDNNSYKLKLKEKYNNIYITNLNIGHTSLFNTTPDQVLSSVIELYILTMSQSIYAGSVSGFSFVASQFRNIPLIK